MRGKSLALLVLALGCGLVASIGVTQVIAKRNAEPAGPVAETQTIFVALEDISMGDPLTSKVLKLEDWPKGKVPKGALADIKEVECRRARTKIFSGEPIIDRKLLKRGETSDGSSVLIPKGLRVVSVKVDKVSSGGGLILPGDRVDVVVYLTRCPTRGIPETCTRTVLQDIKIFAVNDQFKYDAEGSDKRSINAQTVSLLVTPEQAQKVMLSEELGNIRLVLRSPDADEESADTVVTARDILRGLDSADREKEDLMEPEPSEKGNGNMNDFLKFLNQNRQAKGGQQPGPVAIPPSAENTTWNMRIVRAGEVENIRLEEETAQGTNTPTWRSRPSSPAGDEAPPLPGIAFPGSTATQPPGEGAQREPSDEEPTSKEQGLAEED